MIKIKDLLDMIEKFEKEEISDEEMRKYFFDNVEVKTFLPISQKRVLLNKTLEYVGISKFGGDIIQQSLMTEVVFKLNTIFAYTNIAKPKNLDEVLYNKLSKTGLLEFILNNIGYDYIELKDSFNRMFIYSSFIAVQEIINPAALERLSNMVNEITTTMKDSKSFETLRKLAEAK